jgi:hypothetical protein
MNESDREYLSRFTLDPSIENSFEDLYGSNLSDDDGVDSFDNDNLLDAEDLTLEDDFLFKN